MVQVLEANEEDVGQGMDVDGEQETEDQEEEEGPTKVCRAKSER